MKQKYQYIILLLLTLALMMLASCRTKSQYINNASVDSLSFHQKDSVSTKLDFSFDRMIITYLDNLREDSSSSTVTPSRNYGREGHGVRGASITIENGKLATASDYNSSTDTDLKSAKVEKKQVHIRSEPNRLYIFFFLCFFVFIFVIYKKCSSR